ncbi:MAG TPA: DUF4124 domain-containing protein [Methylophilus sp.]
MIKTLSVFLLLIITTSAVSTAWAEGGKIVKWVDKDGVTHYDDKAPMPSATSKSSELNKQGMTVKKITYAPQNTQADKAVAEQTRRDSALIASYNSADEIDMARDRNTKMDEFALQSLYQKLENQQTYLNKNSTLIAGYHKRKQPVPNKLLQDKQAHEADIANTDKQIVAKKQEIEAIRARYNHDKTRFMMLKAQGHTFTPQVITPAKPATTGSAK